MYHQNDKYIKPFLFALNMKWSLFLKKTKNKGKTEVKSWVFTLRKNIDVQGQSQKNLIIRQ